MKLARALGAIGRALISAGVIVLLFVAYQLWGTGLQHSAAQGDLEDDFLQLLDSDIAQQVQQVSTTDNVSEAPREGSPEDDPGTDAETATDDAAASSDDDESGDAATSIAVPQADDEVFYSPEVLELLYPAEGESLARVVIPAINVDQITVEGVSVEDLRKGPGHYPSTPNPGQAGNAAIAGHRTTYGAPFHRVDELQPGDEIIVTTIQGVFTYLVTANDAPDGTQKGHFIVSPSDTWVLGQDTGKNLLTLTACHPKYSARQRIIVQAELVGEPAATPPRDSSADYEPVELDAGAEDEARTDERAAGADVEQVISDEVAADDDPSVDADGNPVQAEGAEGEATGDNPSSTDDAPTDVDAADSEASDEETDATAESEAPAADDVELTAASAPIADEDFGEGLDGDPTKIRPAIMWGLAGGAIWLAAWFIGQRLNRKWTLYLLGLVPFAPVLWSCFVNIDQALPSY